MTRPRVQAPFLRMRGGFTSQNTKFVIPVAPICPTAKKVVTFGRTNSSDIIV
jgi:hypothetical protein